MASPDLVYTVVYFLLGICFVAPPVAFVSAGLTVQNMFGSLLGSEDLSFIQYHLRRTSVTLVFHSVLPLGYYVGKILFVPESEFLYPWLISFHWRMFLAVSFILPVCAAAMTFHWARSGWSLHPIAKTLQHHAPRGSNWRAVASAINVEFRRIDKFTTGNIGRRLIVTDSWIMQTTTYFVHVAHQSDIHLSLSGTDEHTLSHDGSGSTGAQYLNIVVDSVNDRVKCFTIRLNALEYSDLRNKVQSPIRNARNIVVRQSLSDRFLQAFTEQVMSNNIFQKSENMELEPCIGCMQTPSNVKLQKHCDDIEVGQCVQCYCRPMWCLECMGKWFASRQNQNEPQTWLSGRSPCPTCRAVFCMLDVCRII